MTKEARKKAILRLMRDTQMVMPVKVIYTNLKRRGYTFAYATVRRHLLELEEEGRVRRLDEPSTYYELTDKGSEWLDED